MGTILLIEDDAPISALLLDHLTRHGHEVHIVDDGQRALQLVDAMAKREAAPPDLVLLDRMLPGLGGTEVCAAMRQAPLERQPIVIMLTAKTTEEDAVAGFAAGADDYVRKPFGVVELGMRIEALLALAHRWRRTTTGASPRASVTANGLCIDLEARAVMVNGLDVEFTPKEHDLLVFLATHPGIAIDRQRLLREVWGYSHAGYSRTVDWHVARIRRKLDALGVAPNPIVTVHGFGYRFEGP